MPVRLCFACDSLTPLLFLLPVGTAHISIHGLPTCEPPHRPRRIRFSQRIVQSDNLRICNAEISSKDILLGFLGRSTIERCIRIS
ncbi:hypothetical protein EV424DRAFT_169723 [Suillus variegatus]|nr:hypothetical protein EV424DRAFT_169723 [Suillus variegatus]